MALLPDLCSLPVELHTSILSNLSPRQTISCRRISRHFRTLIDDKKNQRSLYIDEIKRMLHKIADKTERHLYFSIDTREDDGIQTAFIRAGIDHLRFYGLTLDEAIKNSHVLVGFVNYYCHRYKVQSKKAYIDTKAAANWLTFLLTYYQACHFPSGNNAGYDAAFKQTTSARILHGNLRAGLLLGEPHEECMKLIKFLEKTPGLYRPRYAGSRKLRVLNPPPPTEVKASVLNEIEGKTFLSKVGLNRLPEYAPMQYFVTTRGKHGEWVLEKVKAVGKGEEIGWLQQALVLETIHLS
ncbi:Putative F-box domain-containing protein [Septoria linicola]|uniref:F-box domain-containing protein n=1 Tax=Septoria linicola TaxID=215465 RepID=A0A9Q9EHP3_9PEZI|nr:putative F-box domain-containing protein [Septoria linicola]USW50234.1 Putative F-box domain-containing protein [Septoria linicola]